MTEPFMAEVRMMSFAFPPKGWAQCDGQLLPINQNQALFALLGTNFGGDGRVNFGLPDLRGRTPIHVGSGYTLGNRGGETAHSLNISELPTHTHVLNASGNTATNTPSNTTVLARSNPQSAYASPSNLIAMDPRTLSNVGGSQPHENMQPYLVVNFCIALQGIFPSQT